MGNLFNSNNAFWILVGKIVDAMLLGLVWIVCCIPIVTAGAATTGVYYVTLKMVRDEEGYVFRSFFKSFKENMKQSTLLWIIYLLIGFFFSYDIYYYYHQTSQYAGIMIMIFLVLSFLYLLSLLYVFAVVSKFSNTALALIRVSLILPIRHFLSTVLMVTELLVALFVVYTIPPMIIFMPGVYMFVSSYHLRKIFDIYCEKILEREGEEMNKQEEMNQQEEESETE